MIGRPGTIQTTTRRGGRTFIRLSVAVLALCLLHHLLMATLGHAIVMGALHEGGSGVAHAPVASMQGARNVGGHVGQGMPSIPMPLLGDCPAQQAVLPLLLLVPLLLGLVLLSGPRGVFVEDSRSLRPLDRAFSPPLSPQRRRALLQVFTI